PLGHILPRAAAADATRRRDDHPVVRYIVRRDDREFLALIHQTLGGLDHPPAVAVARPLDRRPDEEIGDFLLGQRPYFRTLLGVRRSPDGDDGADRDGREIPSLHECSSIIRKSIVAR